MSYYLQVYFIFQSSLSEESIHIKNHIDFNEPQKTRSKYQREDDNTGKAEDNLAVEYLEYDENGNELPQDKKTKTTFYNNTTLYSPKSRKAEGLYIRPDQIILKTLNENDIQFFSIFEASKRTGFSEAALWKRIREGTLDFEIYFLKKNPNEEQQEKKFMMPIRKIRYIRKDSVDDLKNEMNYKKWVAEISSARNLRRNSSHSFLNRLIRKNIRTKAFFETTPFSKNELSKIEKEYQQVRYKRNSE